MGIEMKREFYRQLLECCNQRTDIFRNVSIPPKDYPVAGAGKAHLVWEFLAKLKYCRVTLYFSSKDGEINRKRFNNLRKYKNEIEKEFGKEFKEILFWNYDENRKHQWLIAECPYGTLQDEKEWKKIQSDMVNRLIRLEKAVHNYLPEIDNI